MFNKFMMRRIIQPVFYSYFTRFFSTAKVGGVNGEMKFSLENHEWYFQYEK